MAEVGQSLLLNQCRFRTVSGFGFQIWLRRSSLQNRTKLTEYEALEKVWSPRPSASLTAHFIVRPISSKARKHWALIATISGSDYWGQGLLAEGVRFELTVRFPAHTLSKRAP